MKYLDMYGQPIQFKYNNSAYFATTCGLIASIIVVIIIIVYIVLYIIDVAEMSVPIVLNVPLNQYPSPRYDFIPDYNGYFNSKNDNPDLKESEPYTGYLQLAIGIRNRNGNQWIPFTSTNLIVDVENVIKEKGSTETKNYPLFYDKCKRIGYLKEEIFSKMNLNNVYCIYSPFILNRDVLDEEEYGIVKVRLREPEKGLQLKNINELDSYKTFKEKINMSTTASEENNKWSAYIDGENGSNDNVNDFNIDDHDFYFMYLNTLINETKIDDTIHHYLDWKQIELNNKLSSNVSVFFQKNKLTSFKTVIPKSMSDKNTTEYYISFDNDKYSNTPGSVSESQDNKKVYLEIIIKSSDRINQPERTYTSLFDILGKIGGLSKIIILIGGLFVIYSSSTRLKESLVNDFYSIIDPIHNENINKDFISYLTEISSDANNASSNANSTQTELQMKENELKEFFLPKASKLINIYNNINDESVSYEDKGMFYISKIVYHLSLKEMYSGLKYSTGELTANFFCCCCVSRRLKRKNKVFRKAVNALHKDTDFVSILECVQNVESIKEIFLQRETQLGLFKGLANKPFYIDDKKRKDKEKEKKDEKENLYREKMESVYENLMMLLKGNSEKEEMELDRSLVLNLLEREEKEDGRKLMDIVERVVNKRMKEEMVKKIN